MEQLERCKGEQQEREELWQKEVTLSKSIIINLQIELVRSYCRDKIPPGFTKNDWPIARQVQIFHPIVNGNRSLLINLMNGQR
jgi:hypothetical protein